jgi:4-amino-4-deoxy-L-arabinose transferase-like glycosyltransferase
VVRFWALTAQPGGLYPDEAAFGLSAQNLLTVPGFHPFFFNINGGLGAPFTYLLAAVFKVFQSSVFTLRATAGGVGVAGVIATFVATRRFGRAPALLAMGWTAGSLWMIAISRDGFENILTVAFGALALAAMLRWGDRPGRATATIAGAAVALGLWTYQPLKLLLLLAILWLLWMRARDRARFRAVLATWRWALVAFLVVAAPMIVTAITDASGYFGRAASVSAFYVGTSSPDSYPVHVLRTISMFLFTGDPNERHDVDALPMLGPLLFVLFALGIWRCWRRRDDHGHALVLLGLPVFLLPPLLATEGFAPHFLRSLGLAPYVAACVGLGCIEAVDVARRFTPRFSSFDTPIITRVAWAACALAVVGVSVASAVTYVNRPIEDRYSPFTFADVALADAAVNDPTNGGPSTLLILDSYDAIDVQFLDAGRVPTIVAPMRAVGNPAVYSLIVAPSLADIAAAVGAPLAAEAHAVATDPSGSPVAFEVVPQPAAALTG